MDRLDAIENALATRELSPGKFERFAQDSLVQIYPGLSPIPGGTDWGRDGDITVPGETIPRRLLVTSSPTLRGVQANMRNGIQSMLRHGVAFEWLVLANPASLSLTDRQKLVDLATRLGAKLLPSDIYDRSHFASKLRRDGYWRKELLGLGSGTVALSNLAPSVAQSPWRSLPLVARAEDLHAISADGDLILSGPPGVGKSRIVGEIDDVVFVDKDATTEQICSDLRWVQPRVVAIDDCGQDERLVRTVNTLRLAEPEQFAFRIIAICWPHEIASIEALLPNARSLELSLIDRGSLDEVLVAMGIRRQVVRSEVLDQAEGRPGWAVALGDLLLDPAGSGIVRSGARVVDEVDGFLRKAGLHPDTIDVLAIVSVLGGIRDGEFHRVSNEVGVNRTAFRRLLLSAAHSGLVDVVKSASPSREGDENIYTVRPPILAQALASRQAFRSAIPLLDFDGLVKRWPDRLPELARVAILATLRGADRARSQSDSLYRRVVGTVPVNRATEVSVSLLYLQLDRASCESVVCKESAIVAEVLSRPTANPWELEASKQIAVSAARIYEHETAIAMLLDIEYLHRMNGVIGDAGPGRKAIQSLIHEFHPELKRSKTIRHAIASAATQWMTRRPVDDYRVSVALGALFDSLDPKIRSSVAHPGDPRTLQLSETVVGSVEMLDLYEKIWPIALSLPERGYADAVDRLVDVAEGWLRIGANMEHPFGQDYPDKSVATAYDVGARMVSDLSLLGTLSLGYLMRIRTLATRYSVTVSIDCPSEYEPYFADWDSADDWRAADRRLNAALARSAKRFVEIDPEAAVLQLVDIKKETARAKVHWPNRVGTVVHHLSMQVSDPAAWLEVSIRHSLLPEGCTFIDRTIEAGRLTGAMASVLLRDESSRSETIRRILSHRGSTEAIFDEALSAIGKNDLTLLITLAIRDEVTDDVAARLLTAESRIVESLTALALFVSCTASRPRVEFPGTIEDLWLAAIQFLDLREFAGQRSHEVADLFRFMVDSYPKDLVRMVISNLENAEEGEVYSAMPLEIWHSLWRFPFDEKATLLSRFDLTSPVRALIMDHIVGEDVEFLTYLLDEGEIEPAQALSGFNGLGPQPGIDQLAAALVPRGVEPAWIAQLRMLGSWSGEPSARYDEIVNYFRGLSHHADANVRLVASEGIAQVEPLYREAVEKEFTQRVRGEY